MRKTKIHSGRRWTEVATLWVRECMVAAATTTDTALRPRASRPAGGRDLILDGATEAAQGDLDRRVLVA